jgi:hypothetical protein
MPKFASKYAKSLHPVEMKNMISRTDVDRFEKVGSKPVKGPYDPTDKVYDFNIDNKLPKLTHKIEL